MKKSSRFYLKYNPDNRWSFWTGKWWSLCSEISGQFTPKLGGQFDRLFHSDKIKSNLKKVIDRNLEYCVSYASYEMIKQTLLRIAHVLHGMHDEFRENYHPHAPVMNNGGFQIISMNSENNFAESPSLAYWEIFMKYKNFN